MHRLIAILLFCASAFAAPVFLDDQFELPSGFRIYRAAEKELTGGSYALRFDGQGRLLVGDGTALRRLIDHDGNGVFDSYEVIATGLGWRGPQGILDYGDNLYCVGGDGIQMYSGYTNGPLKHLGRIGEKFNTGGDHDGHTLLRGHDGYIYFMAGNGAGITNRTHITEATSPCLIEREASVFRISPDGKKWECIANGGRNPPNLGINYLGDFFSFDSDMEWHVGLPWYRPCRLNHWVIGGDQGWQEVGAYPPYYIDNLPGILDVGRGSPTWGVFYEHTQFPKKYENAYLCCDYRWKAESNDEYHTTGRLVSFFLERSGSRWKAKMETLARPKPGAKDANGRSIPFALVDIDVAPDGSIYLTEHNQGIWRIIYDPKKLGVPAPTSAKTKRTSALDELLSLPQMNSEWSRLAQETLMKELKPDELKSAARNTKAPLDRRLKAIRLLAPNFATLDLAKDLAKDKAVEIRAQAAWLGGLRGGDDWQVIKSLLGDADPFVRRRAAEALLRSSEPGSAFMPDDPDRTVRYVGMTGLRKTDIDHALSSIVDFFSSRTKIDPNYEFHLRIWTAACLQNIGLGEKLVGSQMKQFALKSDIISKNLDGPNLINKELIESSQLKLDTLRVIGRYEPFLKGDTRDFMKHWLASRFPDRDKTVSWEQARLIGQFQVSEAFPKLLQLLVRDSDHARQFHFFQCIAKLTSGWTSEDEQKLVNWVRSTQTGWFADYQSKGVEFPLFLETALDEFIRNHTDAFKREIWSNAPHRVASLALELKERPEMLSIMMFEADEESAGHYLKAAARVPDEKIAEYLRRYAPSAPSPRLKQLAVAGLKAMPPNPENDRVLKQVAVSNKPERADAEIHAAIVAASLEAGDAVRGRKIYERLQCNSCHGGGQTPGQEGRIFGPDLAGVTARLTRAELADAMVYPSKQVADRFKALAVTLKDGRELTGFVTERAADHVTFVDAQTIHRLAPAEIVSMAPQEKSLMPDGLLRTLNDQEIAHLLKFLSVLGTK